MKWLTRIHRTGHSNGSTLGSRDSDLSVTACILARLGELPAEYLPQDFQEHIKISLDYLEQRAIAGSGWSRCQSGEADAFTTAWAILALRCHRRAVPRAAIEFLLRCREPNGGFTAHPHCAATNGNRNGNAPSAEITVTALRALSMCDRAGGDFLTSHLRSDFSSMSAAKSSRFYVCSEILDWESGLAPWPLLHLVSQSGIQYDLGRPYEQALLLRILFRLRNQRAWLAAASLRQMQLPDGSWPSSTKAPAEQDSAILDEPLFAHGELLPTITAISALAIHESRPGRTDTRECNQRSWL
jgi:hypothetical protein